MTAPPRGVAASVLVRLRDGREHHGFSEQVTLHASGGAVVKLPFAVRALLIGDLPINLWWRSTQPPPFAGPILHDLAENAQQIIYDSLGWTDPTRAVAATYSWLQKVEQGLRGGRWRVASDLNWRRLKYWRRLITQALDDSAAPGAVGSTTELIVQHGPRAVVQAWELVSWLTSQLGWQVQAGKVEQGLEIVWQFQAPHGLVRVRVHRLPDGPSEVRLLGVQCLLGGVPGAVMISPQDKHRLVVTQVGVSAAPRTANYQLQSPAELLSRQLSDRERDPVFTQSMAVAQALAKSCLN
jgi:glucose-6-phosphate dehydrogenase assembly protein OpcA